MNRNGARKGWIASSLLLLCLAAVAAGLAGWKVLALRASAAESANQPEPVETVAVATAVEREHRPTTTAVGTVLALRSIQLRNEVPGTVRQVNLTPGQVVEPGTVLVALDVSVEEAELKALEAQATLARTVLTRLLRMSERDAASATEVDRAVAERDVALAQIARTKAVMDRKTIRAPFRARVGMSDVHVGQYLVEGTQLTTLQGVDDSSHIDFNVAQRVAAGLRPGDTVELLAGAATPVPATVVAVDDRVVPGHSFKYIAALQQADPNGQPQLIRIETRAGHGSGKPTDKIIEEASDVLAFFAHFTGLKL